MDIIMIRHGESEDNIKKIFSRDDTSLTEKGIEQIKRTKETLKEFTYDKVYYSPLSRTVETLENLGLVGTEELRVREINFGIFTGRTFEEISEVYSDETKLWLEDANNYVIPQGESLLDVYNRVKAFIEEISKEKENILIVTHDCVIRLAMSWIFDNPDYFFKFKIDNGSINIISIEDDYKYIKKLNYN
ncbi:histidine phosphatase family protein [Tissierella sp.]|uniref:histidine phosphatase family protein n=1 Tax=Tissierella sp. TaxID=41274 RepID=UPI0028593B56|nr:histidine phosphatase family protein [Tissierella sp.]MDR7855778.1 histidine phosphatase family protein [Tissierella sp.]